jgi:hypothetical protein
VYSSATVFTVAPPFSTCMGATEAGALYCPRPPKTFGEARKAIVSPSGQSAPT